MVLTKAQRRAGYFDRLTGLIEKYPKIVIVHADHVGSRQMAEIRFQLRGKALVLMGKNTMIRTAIRKLSQTSPQVEKLLDEVKLNVGLVFCIEDPVAVRKLILENKVPAPARQGVVAPIDVMVPCGPTGLDPSQTSFFQALDISTKIVKGQIEIQKDVDLITVGSRVTASQSALLQKLGIRPFSYGLVPSKIYDEGSVYDAAILDTTDDDIIQKFSCGIQNVAALSREIGFPNSSSIVHSVVEAFKFCTAICIESGDFTFPQMEQLRKFVEDPSAFAVAAPAQTAAAPITKEAAPVEEEEEDEEEDMCLDLFG